MNRKDEHVSLAKAFHKPHLTDFDAIRIIHHSLPELQVADVSLTTTLAQQTISSPFYINAMTGGSEKTKKINEQLALVARETHLAMATGSVSAALKDSSVRDSFTIVRETNPNGVLLANVGAGTSLENAQAAVDLLQADALQIHLNAPQELVMPEGDRDFRNWLADIAHIVAHLSVPVIVKEVGFGMTRETIQQLVTSGVQAIDISGRGGTSFTQIENARRSKREFSYLVDFGQSTVQSLLEAKQVTAQFELIASGGIRNAYDIFKALCLGAQSVGVSGTILNELLTNGVEATIELVQRWQQELQTLLALTGCQTIADTQKVPLLLTGDVRAWCDARAISLQTYANRS